MKIFLFILISLSMIGCGSFKAERVDAAESDKKALSITDEWVNADTEKVVKTIVGQMMAHKKFRRYMSCLLYTSPSPRDQRGSRMPSSA